MGSAVFFSPRASLGRDRGWASANLATAAPSAYARSPSGLLRNNCRYAARIAPNLSIPHQDAQHRQGPRADLSGEKGRKGLARRERRLLQPLCLSPKKLLAKSAHPLPNSHPVQSISGQAPGTMGQPPIEVALKVVKIGPKFTDCARIWPRPGHKWFNFGR